MHSDPCPCGGHDIVSCALIPAPVAGMTSCPLIPAPMAGMTPRPLVPAPVEGRAPPSDEDQPHRAMQRQIHVFWSCRWQQQQSEMRRRRPCRRRRDSLAQHCGWLLQTPPRIHNEVWAVACLTAVEQAEQLFYHTHTLITAFFPAPPAPASTPPVTEEDPRATLVCKCLLTPGSGPVLVCSE